MSLFRLFDRTERRTTLENPNVSLSDPHALEFLGLGQGAGYGATEVSITGSLAMSAVFRGASVISNVAASLPFKAYAKGTRDERSSNVLDDPHPEMTPLEFWRLSYMQRVLWGNSYARIIRAPAGQAQWLHPLDPNGMRVGRVKHTNANPWGKLFVYTDPLTGEQEGLTPYDVFHVPALGYDGICGVSPVRLARVAVGLGLAAEKYGEKLFNSGSLMSGILQTEQRLDDVSAGKLQDRWDERMGGGIRNAARVGVLDRGAKFQPTSMPNSDAQFLESRQFQVPEVARFMGVPAFLMFNTEKSTSWGTGLEQQATGWVKFDLGPTWLQPTEARVTKHLLPAGRYAKVSVDGLLRGDSVARASFYNVMRMVGAMSSNDIRALEDLPPVPNGDTYLQPLNMAPLGTEPEDNATPAPTEGNTDDGTDSAE